jgi:sugar phosphate isomerase/epimerase
MPRVNAVSFHEYKHIEAICRVACQSGFDALEVSRPPFYEKLTTPETRSAFLRWCETSGLSLYGFDCWVEVEPFAAFDQTLVEFDRALEFTVALDLGLMVSHDTWCHTHGKRSPSQVLDANVRLFREVAKRTAARNVKLVFEPHPDTLSMNNAWCADFVDAVAEGQDEGMVGVLFDTCHYGVGQPGAYVDAIGQLGRRIQHVHYSDGDTTTYALHLPVGDGCLDLAAVNSALIQIGFAGSLTCDLYNYPLLEEGARRSATAIRDVERELGLAS